MRIVNTTSVFPKCHDSFDALERLAKAGYDAVDMAFDYCVQSRDFPFMTDRYESWAYKLRDRAEELGVAYSHSHASFDASVRGQMPERTLCCTDIMGIEYIVVHPCCHIGDRLITDDEEFITHNKNMILSILELAEGHDITVLTENLLNGAGSRVVTVSQLVREVGCPHFGWCYDVGHHFSNGGGLADLLNVCTAPLSLHIHDNHGNYDDHLIPGDGKIDWGELLRLLKTVGYKGDLVLEAHEQCKEAPDPLRDGILEDILRRSRKMLEYYNGI